MIYEQDIKLKNELHPHSDIFQVISRLINMDTNDNNKYKTGYCTGVACDVNTTGYYKNKHHVQFY